MTFLLTLLLFALPARANYLSYVDDKGTKHVVESPSEIPEKYRSGARTTTAGGKARSTQTTTNSATATAISVDVPKPFAFPKVEGAAPSRP